MKSIRLGVYICLGIASLLVCLLGQPSIAVHPSQLQLSHPPTPSTVIVQDVGDPLAQSQRLYESGQWEDAIAFLERAIETAAQSGDWATQVMAWRNLALVHQQLQQFEPATRATNAALSLLEEHTDSQPSPLLASVLDVQGGIFFSQGQSERALQQWDDAASIYDSIGAEDDAVQTRINQAQAYQRLGFYRKAIALLTPITEQPQTQPQAQPQAQPDSAQTAIALRSLGDALRFVGDLNQSRTVLESSLEMAERLQRNDLAHSAQLSVANTLHAQGDSDSALMVYDTLVQTASGEIRIQALSNQLALLIHQGQTADAKALWPTIQAQLASLPPSQPALFARINVIQQFIRLGVVNQPSRPEQAEQLAIAIQQAHSLGDIRSESYGIGILGSLYEATGRLEEAQALSEQALDLAQAMNATDIGYLWQWQLGRIYKTLGDRDRTAQGKQQNYQKATSAYSDAVDTLQQLRTDLVTVNAQVQVSFQDSVEPIHRELVGLLLDPKRNDTTPDDIEKARTVIESLQLAELDNFFREACLDTEAVDIDQLDAKAAVVYPIMLRDRLEVVVSFPNHDLKHYTTPVPRETVEALVAQLRQHLTLRIGNRFRPGMAQMYDWLIRPMMADVENSQVETLVFVLDGALRNLPMAALYDRGEQTFLVESFSIAVTPGLQLVNPQPIQEQNLSVLTGALSEARQGFSALPNVVPEVEQIQSTVPAQVLLNAEFTEESFQSALKSNAEPIVHLATHGKFSSNKEETFLLTWDGQLSINALNDVLQVSTLNQSGSLELLVLSACQTATGDKEAALGLAGMAVRAGARSTVATLWQVNDEATALLMEKLYEELSSRQVSKAEALRQAQLKILNVPQFRKHPYYWAPFILVGNWL